MNNPLFRYLLIIIGLILIINTVKAIGDAWQAGVRVDKRGEKIVFLEKENQKIKQKISEVESPEYLEQIARNKLNLTKPGEEIIILPKDIFATNSANLKIDSRSNLEKWRDLIF
ncbi:MAG: septum formation initiator family protein [bacterium]|nr:septum formation initiator family protein [bacterium]